jgi:4-hydroxy-4-methyl-2-oxoglutarate aldolase
MPVIVHPRPDRLPDEADRWRGVPVAVAVDLDRAVGPLDPAIRPLRPPGQQPRLFGRALTARCDPPDFGAVLHAIDQAQAGDVLVIAAAGHRETAMIGEILGGHLHALGGAGIVCDGAVRDVGALVGLAGFAVFARFVTPRGPISAERGAVGEPIVVGGCLVRPGDLILGDDDGVVALAPDVVSGRIGDAEARLSREAAWVRDLAAGRGIRATFGLDGGAVP